MIEELPDRALVNFWVVVSSAILRTVVGAGAGKNGWDTKLGTH